MWPFFTQLDDLFWSYFAFILIMGIGLILTFSNRFFQIRSLFAILKNFFSLFRPQTDNARGIHPLKVFFASVGGMIGIGNVVGIVTAVQLGGPGALLWVWVAGLIGSTIKYSEIYLGLKYRVPNAQGGYDGGPMYFLRKAFPWASISLVVAVLLCIYGVEVYQFSVIVESVSSNWGLSRLLVMGLLLGLVLYGGSGGINRLGKICSLLMPLFIVTYVSMALWILFQNLPLLPHVLHTVFTSAFTGHAAVGGFAGSTLMLAIHHGMARAAYSADLGIGYDAIIQSESKVVQPERQASLAIVGVGIDNLICTLSILLILVTGVWSSPLVGSQLVQTALSGYFPLMHIFMPLFLITVGYTTIIAYFCVGIKCARFLSPKHGAKVYFFYGCLALITFSFFDQSKALLTMSLAGALLLMINLSGIFKLRKEINFSLESTPPFPEAVEESAP